MTTITNIPPGYSATIKLFESVMFFEHDTIHLPLTGDAKSALNLMIAFDKATHSRPLGAFIRSDIKEHSYTGTLISLETPDESC